MRGGPHAQDGFEVRFDWGPTAAVQLGSGPGTLVIVDVLSFTTAVSVAVERGVAVYPAATERTAVVRAREVCGELAVARSEVTADRPWSLSPAHLGAAPAPERLVLPSPNGSSIAAAVAGTAVAACLRNATAVGSWLAERCICREAPVTVIAAGERWPDGSLRPALEDLLGAGAVLVALAQQMSLVESPEAAAARALYESTSSPGDAVRRSASGAELVAAGFGADVEIAVESDASRVVPVRIDGAFRDARNDDVSN